MKKHLWIENFPGAITVCDKEGVILEMNSAAVDVFSKEDATFCQETINNELTGSNPLALLKG